MAYQSYISHPETLWPSPVSLLPHNETAWEHGQELSDAGRYPMNFGDAIRAKDEWACSASILPFLAWERSVDVWLKHWNDSQRRYSVNQAFPLQRAKGTDYGMRRYVSIAGGTVRLIEAPPMRAFASDDMTAAERAIWLSQFKQLRSYPFSKFATSKFGMFLSNDENETCLTVLDGDNSPGNAPVPAGLVEPIVGYFVPPDLQCAPDLNDSSYLGNNTTLFDPATGIETPTIETVYEQFTATGETRFYHQVFLADTVDNAWFAGDWPTFHRKIATGQDGAPDHILWFPRSIDYMEARVVTTLQQNAPFGTDAKVAASQVVSPGLVPITMVPDHVYETIEKKKTDWFLGETPTYWATPDTSSLYVYNVLYMYDPTANLRGPPQKLSVDAAFFAGFSYTQFPAYRANVRVEILTKLSRPQQLFDYGLGYAANDDLSFFVDVIEAVKAAKSARDDVWIDTLAYDVAKSGQTVDGLPLLFGQIKFGQRVHVPITGFFGPRAASVFVAPPTVSTGMPLPTPDVSFQSLMPTSGARWVDELGNPIVTEGGDFIVVP